MCGTGGVEVMGQGTRVNPTRFRNWSSETGPQTSIVEKVEKLEKTAEMDLFKSFEIK